MLENLQENLFGQKQTDAPQQSYRVDFHANPIALQENVWHLMTSAICGANSLGCFAKLTENGLWEKMYQGCSQVKMEGFSDEYSGTWPKSGVLHGGIVSQPILAELSTSGNGFALWPRPIASDGEVWLKCSKSNPMQSIRKCWKNGKQDRTNYYHIQNGLNPNQAADLNGMMMGFPEGWTG